MDLKKRLTNKEFHNMLAEAQKDPKFKKELRNRILYVAGTLTAIASILKFFGIW